MPAMACLLKPSSANSFAVACSGMRIASSSQAYSIRPTMACIQKPWNAVAWRSQAHFVMPTLIASTSHQV